MSFILQTAARVGCATPQSGVAGGVGSVNESAPKPPKLFGAVVHTSESVPKGLLLPSTSSSASLSEAVLKDAIDAVRRNTDYSFIFGESHDPKPSEKFDTPLDCAKAGHYKIKRHYKELDLFDISTPAGEYTISGYQLNLDCPEPRV